MGRYCARSCAMRYTDKNVTSSAGMRIPVSPCLLMKEKKHPSLMTPLGIGDDKSEVDGPKEGLEVGNEELDGGVVGGRHPVIHPSCRQSH